MDEPHENADILKQIVQDGFATLHRLIFDHERIGLIITRIDEGSEGRELVVVSVFSESKYPLTSTISEAIDAMAKKEGCCSIRFHTARHGLAKLACDFFGFHVSEIILRKDT